MDKRYEELTKAFEGLLNEKLRDLRQEAMTRFEVVWLNTLEELERNIQQKDVKKSVANKLRLDLLNEVRE